MMSNIVDDFSPAMWYNSIMKDCVGAIVGAIPRWLLVSSSRPTAVWQEMSNIVDDFSFTMWYNSIMQECVEAIVGSSPAVAFVVERRCRCRANPNDPVPAKVARTSVMDSTASSTA